MAVRRRTAAALQVQCAPFLWLSGLLSAFVCLRLAPALPVWLSPSSGCLSACLSASVVCLACPSVPQSFWLACLSSARLSTSLPLWPVSLSSGCACVCDEKLGETAAECCHRPLDLAERERGRRCVQPPKQETQRCVCVCCPPASKIPSISCPCSLAPPPSLFFSLSPSLRLCIPLDRSLARPLWLNLAPLLSKNCPEQNEETHTQQTRCDAHRRRTAHRCSHPARLGRSLHLAVCLPVSARLYPCF